MNVIPKPQAPLFTVSQKPCFIDFQTEAETHTHVTRLSLVNNTDSEWLAFDAVGNVWSFSYERPAGGFSAFSRLLARSFYNPVSRVAVTWSQVRPYALDELRQHYLDAIAADDDILTQFVDPDELCARVRACSTFQDFVATWEWQSTDATFNDESESAGNA